MDVGWAAAVAAIWGTAMIFTALTATEGVIGVSTAAGTSDGDNDNADGLITNELNGMIGDNKTGVGADGRTAPMGAILVT